MSNKCLYCYEPVEKGPKSEYHERCSLEFFGSKEPPIFSYSLEQMTALAKNVVERSISVPGVQPKLSLSVVNEALGNGDRGRLTVVGALGGNYIFKPPSGQHADMPENEHVTMRMAEKVFGIRTVPSSLIRLLSGELAYITKRIDRTSDGAKIHMLDMFQILEAFDKYIGSMERVGKAVGKYSSNVLLDQFDYFQLTLFSYLTGNNDMHLKNFSMISNGKDWTLAPAYDLLNVCIINPADNEELALTLDRRKRKLKLADFVGLAEGMGLNVRQIRYGFSVFIKNKKKAFEWLDRSFLSGELIQAYKSLMEERYRIFEENDKV